MEMKESPKVPECYNSSHKEVIYNVTCYLHVYDTPRTAARGIAEVIIVVWSIIYLVIFVRESTYVPKRVFYQSMMLCPSRLVFLLGCIFAICMVPCRFACQTHLENNFAILCMFAIPNYFLFFCRGFKSTGPFVTMIYRMMAADLLRFVIIYFIFVMGFSQGFYVVFISWNKEKSENPEGGNLMESPLESIISNFIMSLGSFGEHWEEFKATEHKLVGEIHCFLFLTIVYVLLVNLLIAMMGDTYTKIAEIKNEWMRQWARVVLLVERQISSKQRLIEQNNYSEYMATGEKALILKQTMSEEQLEEIRDIIEMKVNHRRNIDKRRKKYGFESGSTIGMNLGASNVICPDAMMEEEEIEEEIPK